MYICAIVNEKSFPLFRGLCMLMKRYFIKLAYNGTAYHGWQVQLNTLTTIQQVINQMLSKLLLVAARMCKCWAGDARADDKAGKHSLPLI